MTASLPTQEQVNEIAREFAPDVVRIKMDIATDWAGDPAVYFRVIVADYVDREKLRDVSRRVRERIWTGLRFEELDHFPYVNFRGQSEQVALRDPSWA